MKTYKKYIIFLGILAVLSPLGIYLPEILNGKEAWGEWSLETVKEQTGIEPEGMKKDAELYHAPLPDYNMGKENTSLSSVSVQYVISGLIGAGIIFILTFMTVKLISRKKSE